MAFTNKWSYTNDELMSIISDLMVKVKTGTVTEDDMKMIEEISKIMHQHDPDSFEIVTFECIDDEEQE